MALVYKLKSNLEHEYAQDIDENRGNFRLLKYIPAKKNHNSHKIKCFMQSLRIIDGP